MFDPNCHLLDNQIYLNYMSSDGKRSKGLLKIPFIISSNRRPDCGPKVVLSDNVLSTHISH